MRLSEIIVSGSDLSRTISIIKTTMRGTYRLAVGIFCDQDCLRIRSQALTSNVAGQGCFEGMAILPLVLLIELAETISSDEKISIKKLPSSISIGPLEFNCEWKEIDYEIPDWPFKATLAQIIGLQQRYEPEILDYQMLQNTIKQAKFKLFKILEQAAEVLTQTGIDIDDLEMLMEDVIKRSAEEDREEIIW